MQTFSAALRDASRHWVTSIIAMVTTAGLVTTLFVGAGSMRSDLGFLDGGAWLWDNVAKIIGFSDPALASDLNPRIGTGDRTSIRIYQGPGGRLYLVDGDGSVTTVDTSSAKSKLAVSEGLGGETVIHPGTRTSYMVDRARGRITAFAADSSPANAKTVAELKNRVQTVIDPNDRLWVLVPATGDLHTYDGDGTTATKAFSASVGKGGASALAVTGRSAVVATKDSDVIVVVDENGSVSPIRMDTPITSRPTASTNASEPPYTAFLVPDEAQIRRVSIESRDEVTYQLEGRGGHEFGQPEPVGSKAWVPDYTAGELVNVDLLSGEQFAYKVPWPDAESDSNRFQIAIGADGTIWANNPDATEAIAIDRSGTPHTITKGQRANLESEETVDEPDDVLPPVDANTAVDRSDPTPTPPLPGPGVSPSWGQIPVPTPAGGQRTVNDPRGPQTVDRPTTGRASPATAPVDAVPGVAPMITSDADDAGNASIDLQWQFPNRTVYRGVTFDVVWRDLDDPNAEPLSQSVGSDTALRITRLRNGHEYSVTVTAFHPEVDPKGLESQAKKFTPSGDKPTAPEIGRVEWTAVDEDTVTASITVDPPTDDGGSEIVALRWWRGWETETPGPEVDVRGKTDWTVDFDVSPSSGLFVFAVWAVNAEGKESIDTSSTFMAPTTPIAPVLDVTDGKGSVTLTWLPPPNPSEFPVTGYRYRVDGGAPRDIPGGNGARKVTVPQSGNTEPVYQVQAVSRIGGGEWSNQVSAISCDVPAKPAVGMTFTPTEYNRQATPNVTFSVTDNPVCPVTSWTVNGQLVNRAGASGSTTLTIVGASTTVTATVTANNIRGSSPAGTATGTSPARTPETVTTMNTIVTLPRADGTSCETTNSVGTCTQFFNSGWIRQEFIAGGPVLRYVEVEVCSYIAGTSTALPILMVLEQRSGNDIREIRQVSVMSVIDGTCRTIYTGLKVGGFVPGQTYIARFTNNPGQANPLLAYLNQDDTAPGLRSYRPEFYAGPSCGTGHFSCPQDRDVRIRIDMSDI